MGNIKKVLLNEDVETPLFNNRLTVELCENVHIHYRNLRLEFSKEEFLQILRELKQIDEGTVESFEYGENSFLSLINKEILPDTCEFDKRLQIEEQVEGHCHVHYRNLRIELRNLMDIGYGLFEVPIKIDMEWFKDVPPGKNIKHIGIKKMRLSQLQVGVFREEDLGDSVGVRVPLEQSPVLDYLRGDTDKYIKYLEVVRKLAIDHSKYSVEKLESLKKSIESRGYNGNLIVVLNDGPMVADGQHRAAILYHLFGDIEIRVANIVIEA